MDEQPTVETIHFDDENRGKFFRAEGAVFIKSPEYSDWQCYMFGNRPSKIGMIYRPVKGYEPNWFVRWMMKVCFDCLWVKDKTT